MRSTTKLGIFGMICVMAGCAVGRPQDFDDDAEGRAAVIEAEVGFLTAPSSARALWAAFVPSPSGNALYVYDFTDRRVLRLAGEPRSFEEGVAALRGEVSFDEIPDPALRERVVRAEAPPAALVQLVPGDYVPSFEVRELEPTIVRASRAAIGSDREPDTCDVGDALETNVVVVVNDDDRRSSAVIGQHASLSRVGGPRTTRTCRGGHGDPVRYAECRDDCIEAGVAADAECQRVYDAAMAAIAAADAACRGGCTQSGYPCAGAVRAACMAACGVATGLAEAVANAALLGCSLGVAVATGACMAACREDYLGDVSGVPRCGGLD